MFDVLEASGTAGKIAAFLGKAFIAVKIADITGIGSLVKFLVIVIGMSYDKMNKKKFVALDRKDFYAYRKKTLAVFRAALQACNRYPF